LTPVGSTTASKKTSPWFAAPLLLPELPELPLPPELPELPLLPELPELPLLPELPPLPLLLLPLPLPLPLPPLPLPPLPLPLPPLPLPLPPLPLPLPPLPLPPLPESGAPEPFVDDVLEHPAPHRATGKATTPNTNINRTAFTASSNCGARRTLRGRPHRRRYRPIDREKSLS
jgi:hypothetical protein